MTSPPIMFPDDPNAQIVAELGWYKATAKTLERELVAARLEVERLRESALDAVTRLENGDEVEDVVQALADGRYPAEVAA